MSKADQSQEQKHHPRYLFFHRLTSQLSIQPNIPSNIMLGHGSDSRHVVSQKASINFPTKQLRMKSLLWTKPTGEAITSCSSTVKQVRS
jgi:hypothetical protein